METSSPNSSKTSTFTSEISRAFHDSIEREKNKTTWEQIKDEAAIPYHLAVGAAKGSLKLLEQGWKLSIWNGVYESTRRVLDPESARIEDEKKFQSLKETAQAAWHSPKDFVLNAGSAIGQNFEQKAVDFLRSDPRKQAETLGSFAPQFALWMVTREFPAEITRAEALPDGFVLPKFPLGTRSAKEFKSYSDMIFKETQSILKKDPDLEAFVGVRGSSVTGRRFRGGNFGPDSDLDFFVVSDKLYQEGLNRGAKGSQGAFYIKVTDKKFGSELGPVEQRITEGLRTHPEAGPGRKGSIRIFSQEGFQKKSVGKEILQRPDWRQLTGLQWQQIKNQFKEGERLWKRIFDHKKE